MTKRRRKDDLRPVPPVEDAARPAAWVMLVCALGVLLVVGAASCSRSPVDAQSPTATVPKVVGPGL